MEHNSLFVMLSEIHCQSRGNRRNQIAFNSMSFAEDLLRLRHKSGSLVFAVLGPIIVPVRAKLQTAIFECFFVHLSPVCRYTQHISIPTKPQPVPKIYNDAIFKLKNIDLHSSAKRLC